MKYQDTKIWIEINDDSRGTWNTNSQIKFKNMTLKSILCDHSDAFVKGTILVENTGATGADENNNNI